MSSTPKWYCRNKSGAVQAFAEITKLGNDLRRVIKRIIIDVKVDMFSEHDNILEECEKVVDLYWSLKGESKNEALVSLTKTIKRSPYNALLMKKFSCLSELNDRLFYQLTFVLKNSISHLLRKSVHSEMWLNWALQITRLYNKCCSMLASAAAATSDCEQNGNICSNLYPALLLPQKPIDFAYILQLVSRNRIEQNSLDLLFGLLNMEEVAWCESGDSNRSSLEILRILTCNTTGDGGDFQQPCDTNREFNKSLQLQQARDSDGADGQVGGQSSRNKYTQQFLQKERVFIWQLITTINQICPSVFGSHDRDVDLHAFLLRGIRLIWSNVGIILDHVILWWIDTPLTCYSLTHIDSIRNWLHSQSVKDIPEPVYSALHGVGEILTNFVATNMWDQLFRLTLISTSCVLDDGGKSTQQYGGDKTGIKETANNLCTSTGAVWVTVFSNLINLSNSYIPHNDVQNPSLLPVAEQIPILHRMDHSVHSMRLWVKEQAKLLCNTWKIDQLFRMLEHDVKVCLEVFTTMTLPKLTADSSDVLALVCVALRAKLISEVSVNIDKMKKTTDDCVQIMAAVCRTLSLANFKLCFPPLQHWQQQNPPPKEPTERGQYVGFVLNAICLPAIQATRDIQILKLVLKIVCEAWLDHIYQQRIKFSVSGACRLLDDFDKVREWLAGCEQLDPENLDKLCNHEVLRMCKGVGKILLRKPADVIMIKESPRYDKKSGDDAMQETHLPSEMFVSNQKHWLQLRANSSGFPCLQLCCGNTSL